MKTSLLNDQTLAKPYTDTRLGAEAQTIFYLNGSMPELVTFTSALTTLQRQNGESNQKAYYGTP